MLDTDDRVRAHHTVATGAQRQRFPAEHGVGLDVGSGGVAEPDTVPDAETHQHGLTVEAHLGDVADVHAGEHDVVAGHQTAGVLEARRVAQTPGEEVQLVVLQTGENDRGGHGQADDARPDVVGVTGCTHSTFAHLPVSWFAVVYRMVVPSGPENLKVLAQRKNWKKFPYAPTRMSFL